MKSIAPSGQAVTSCAADIEEKDETFDAVSSSKKDAKKTAAYAMLQFVLDEEDA